jgi:hypothetical protein
MKKCFKCGQEKELSEFYKHSQMADGHLGKCKECTRSDVRTNRKKNIDYYREYDRDRGNRQTREYILEYREKYPKKYKAMTMVNNAIRDGRMKRETCEICGNKAHAHHDNYDYPLSVRWLCSAHHKQWHMENGEGLNPF